MPKKVIDICVEDLRKAKPYSQEEFEKYLGYEDKGGYDKDRFWASMARSTLSNEGIDFNEFMREYVNNPDYRIDQT